jgi:class 3 adenylate cyclase/tetratricopeptide (TPR) repeat protein
MEPLHVYIPTDRRHRLARRAPFPDWSQGAALFADIAGFTPLTERLVRELGPQQGVEALTHHLNLVYDALIDEVDRYGGSVIGFSGDAITCWFDEQHGEAGAGAGPGRQDDFPAEDGDAGALLRAAACGLAIQAAMQRVRTTALPSHGVALTVKVGVAAGPVRRFLVGHPDIQLIDVMVGTTLDRMAAAERLAHESEVLLDAATVRQLGAAIHIREWRSPEQQPVAPAQGQAAVLGALKTVVPPAPWPPLAGSLSEEELHRWLLPPVYARLQQGQSLFLAELRRATLLFVRFGGIDYDHDPAAGVKLDAYIRWVQEVLGRYEGFLIDVTMGDKGSSLYAAFGAPLAHEDDEARAVAAAWQLVSPPLALSFIGGIQIGLNQGLTRVGAYGGRTRRTYGVLGDEVNLTARLMSQAQPGQVLVSQQIVKAVLGYDFKPLGSITVKGKQEPILVARLQGPRAVPEPRAAPGQQLVGRALERATLAAALQRLRHTSQGGVLVVEGEAGIGKSRLVAELHWQATREGVGVFFGEGEAIEQATLYYGWRAPLRQLGGLDGLDDPATRQQRVITWLALDADTLPFLPLLNELLGLHAPENELTTQLSAEGRLEKTHEFVLRGLRATIAHTPAVLILEDVHWFDSASWGLLLRISRQRDWPLLLVVVSRPPSEATPAEYLQLVQHPDVQRLALTPLGATEIMALICQRLGVAAIPAEVATLIQERAEGHPFFSEELAAALWEAGLLVIADGQCQVAPGAGNLRAVPFPDTLQGVITSRIDRLTPQQQLALKVASVIGRLFAFRILRDVFPLEETKAHLPDDLAHLSRLDLTPLETPEPDLTYIFKHAITHEVAYHLMLAAQRQPLHQAVAEWYERCYQDDLAPFYPRLAHHWREAGVREKAMDYLEKAGTQALRNGAAKEAIVCFEELFRLDVQQHGPAPQPAWPPTPRVRRHIGWELALGRAYLDSGQGGPSRQHLERVGALINRPTPTPQQFLPALTSQLLRQVSHRLLPGRVGQIPAALREPFLDVAEAESLLCSLHLVANEPQFFFFSSLRLLNLCERLGPSSQLPAAYALTCLMAAATPFRGLAALYARQALAAAASLSTPPPTAMIMLSLYQLGIGQLEEALRSAAQGMASSHHFGEWKHWRVGLFSVATVLYNQGKFEESAARGREIYQAAHDREDVEHEAWGLLMQGMGLLALGQTGQAITMFERAIPAFQAAKSSRIVESTNLAELGVAYLHRGEQARAYETADQASRLIGQERPTSVGALGAYGGVAEVALARWEAELRAGHPCQNHQQWARSACQALHACAHIFPIGQPRAWRWQGVYEQLAGNPAKAIKAWQKSLTAARALRMPYDEGLAHYELGRHTTGLERAAHLAHAADLFTRLGTAYRLDQVKCEQAVRLGAGEDRRESPYPLEK